MVEKWIRFVDEANYNLSEIMRDHDCSLEKAQEIAEEWFSDREPEKTLYTTGNIEDTEWEPEELRVPIKPKEIININSQYSIENIVSLIDALKEMCSQYNIESINIDKDYSVTIKF